MADDAAPGAMFDVAARGRRPQTGGEEPSVLIHIQATLAELAEHFRDEEQSRVSFEHIDLVAAAVKRSIDEPYDLQALDDRTSLARGWLNAAL